MTVSCRVVRLNVIIQHFVVMLRTHSVQTTKKENKRKTVQRLLLKRSMELAINNRKDKKNENSDDRNGDYPIRSHPARHQPFYDHSTTRGSFCSRV